MKRIRRLGGKIDYVAMNGVVFFGHERYWPDKLGPAGNDSVDAVAKEVAGRVAAIYQHFPQAQTGDVEPITTAPGFDPRI